MIQMVGLFGAGLAGVAYVPQIWHLIRQRCSAGLSRAAFATWLVASGLVTTNAVMTRSTVFIVLGTIQLTATTVIVVLPPSTPAPTARSIVPAPRMECR